MGFEIVKNESDTFQVKLSNEPDWVRGFRCGDAIGAVGSGSCLIVAFSVWSTPDREEAYKAIEVAKAHGMSVTLGLLPYDYPEEIESWLLLETERPSVVIGKSTSHGAVEVSVLQNEQTSPVWFAMGGGKPIETRQGPLQTDELLALLSTVEQCRSLA